MGRAVWSIVSIGAREVGAVVRSGRSMALRNIASAMEAKEDTAARTLP